MKASYNRLDIPTEWIKDLKEKLKLADKDTIRWIIEYINLDNYELVKNIAWTINDNNAANVIAYRDGSLARNIALRDLLSSCVQSKEYFDRIAQEKKIVRK